MSVEPDRHNFSVWKGTTFRKVLTLHTGDEDSPPKNLTGYTARLVIRDGSGVLRTLTTENGGITLGGAAGTITLFISDEDTEAEAWQTGNYKLFLISPGGDTDLYLFGNFSIKGA